MENDSFSFRDVNEYCKLPEIYRTYYRSSRLKRDRLQETNTREKPTDVRGVTLPLYIN